MLLILGMANVSNVGFTRADEILNGAPVFDKENKVSLVMSVVVLLCFDVICCGVVLCDEWTIILSEV